MKKPYKVVGREFGRSKPWTHSFATVEAAAEYVKEYWQGADYVDGPASFHSDYASFETVGFTLKDIGQFYTTDDGCREFRFNAPMADGMHAGCKGCGCGPDEGCECRLPDEGPNYRDFNPGNDCFPEDWDHEISPSH